MADAGAELKAQKRVAQKRAASRKYQETHKVEILGKRHVQYQQKKAEEEKQLSADYLELIKQIPNQYLISAALMLDLDLDDPIQREAFEWEARRADAMFRLYHAYMGAIGHPFEYVGIKERLGPHVKPSFPFWAFELYGIFDNPVDPKFQTKTATPTAKTNPQTCVPDGCST